MRIRILVSFGVIFILCGTQPGCEGDAQSEGVWLSRGRESGTTLKSMHGIPAPGLDLSDWVNGEGITLDDLRGRVVLLEFWAAWCPVSRKLVPLVKELHAEYADEGLVIIGVHTGSRADEAPPYISEHDIQYFVGFDMDGNTQRAYNITGYPNVYLIDREGILRFANINKSPSNIEYAVTKLLAESG